MWDDHLRGRSCPGPVIAQATPQSGRFMRTIEKNGSVSLGTLVGCIVLAACSSEAELEPSTNVESLEQTLEAVPDDGSEFQAKMTIDADGNIIPGPVTRGVPVVASGWDPRSVHKPLELVEPRRNKVNP